MRYYSVELTIFLNDDDVEGESVLNLIFKNCCEAESFVQNLFVSCAAPNYEIKFTNRCKNPDEE